MLLEGHPEILDVDPRHGLCMSGLVGHAGVELINNLCMCTL